MLITREKRKRDNLDTHEKELLKNYEKMKENWVVTLMMTKEKR